MKIFITGIVGTLGSEIALLHHNQGDIVLGCSRNEQRAIAWRKGNGNITNYVASANSKEMLKLMDSCDRIYHCAALKHVNIAEESPLEAWRQNVLLTADIANDRTIFISSDKACGGGGMGVYGATKLTAERIVIQTGGSVIRLGNLIGSSGSVFQKWCQAVHRGNPIEVTDPFMTRFFISIKEAAQFIMNNWINGKVVAPTMLGICMGRVASRLIEKHQDSIIHIVGTRPGEVKHQYLFLPEDRIKTESGRYILDHQNGVEGTLLRSDQVQQWDVDMLLQEAGVI